MKEFSPERLARLRRRAGMTQEALSRETGISQVSISAIERGRKEPCTSTLARFAHALGCDLNSFFTSC